MIVKTIIENRSVLVKKKIQSFDFIINIKLQVSSEYKFLFCVNINLVMQIIFKIVIFT